ncbi:MAG: glycosyltransferase [Thermaurantimonas sp.]
MWLPEVIFWSSLTGVVYTYQGYSRLLNALPKKAHPSVIQPEEWPSVNVIFAAYNEEAVIGAKLKSLLESDYPQDLLSVTVGSDACTDSTDSIVEDFKKKYPLRLNLIRFERRTGKAEIINQLASVSTSDVLICTDANIIHECKSISRAVALLYSDPTFGAVGGTLEYIVRSSQGIAVQENFYRSWENSIRHAESALWQMPMGLEGGFYAIKRRLFRPIPKNFFMEDFYQTLQLYCAGYRSYMHPEVRGLEDVSTQPREEFQRKKRISTGNFQNLVYFFRCIHSSWKLAFVFWSHKGLRWITPILLMMALISNLVLLSTGSTFYKMTCALAAVLSLLGVVGSIFSKRKQKIHLIVYIYHFFNMNFALLSGLIQYIKGVNTNVWQPTRRNQN